MHTRFVTALAALLLTLQTSLAAAVPITSVTVPPITYIPPSACPEYPVQRVFNHTGILFENLAVRANGDILATTAAPSALLWLIDPRSVRPPILLTNFTTMIGTGGIVEGRSDLFYVVSVAADGPSQVHSVDMNHFVALSDGTVVQSPTIKTVSSLDSTGLLNGMTNVNKMDNFVLIADTLLGGVWKVNITDGDSELVIQDPSMKGPANTTSFQAFGINGLKVLDNVLYYTNSGRQEMYHMPITPTGLSTGPATLVARNLSCDDFAIDSNGIAYVASPANALIKVDTHTGSQLVVAGTFNSTHSTIVSASSVQFGRSPSDRTSVYLTTNGGSFADAPPGSQGVSRVDVNDLAVLNRSHK